MLFEKLHSAREAFEKAQTLSSGLAISMQKISANAAGVDAEIARFEKYCTSRGIPPGEDIAIISLRARRTNMEQSLETLRSRNAQIDATLATKREEILQLESFLSRGLADETENSPPA